MCGDLMKPCSEVTKFCVLVGKIETTVSHVAYMA